jgi:hypothetical protein
MYGLTTIDDESMTVGFDKNNFFYCEINVNENKTKSVSFVEKITEKE